MLHQGPGAVLVSLSVLPALLCSPMFHSRLSALSSLPDQASARSCSMPTICRVILTGLQHVAVRCGSTIPAFTCSRATQSVCRCCTVLSPPQDAAGALCGCRRVHAVCQRPLLRTSFGLEDMFADEDSGEAEPADAQQVLGMLPASLYCCNRGRPPCQRKVRRVGGALLQAECSFDTAEDGSSCWTCSFCSVECTSAASAPEFTARLDMQDSGAHS